MLEIHNLKIRILVIKQMREELRLFRINTRPENETWEAHAHYNGQIARNIQRDGELHWYLTVCQSRLQSMTG